MQSHVSSNSDQKITKSKHGPLPEIALYDKNVDIKFCAHIEAYDIVYHKSIYILKSQMKSVCWYIYTSEN